MQLPLILPATCTGLSEDPPMSLLEAVTRGQRLCLKLFRLDDHGQEHIDAHAHRSDRGGLLRFYAGSANAAAPGGHYRRSARDAALCEAA